MTLDETVKDESDGFFSITSPSITVLSPNGGETWELGKQYTIRWQSRGNIRFVKIMLVKSGNLKPIKSMATNSGSYKWTPRWHNPDLGDYRMVIMTLDAAVQGVSDGVFMIIEPKVDLTFSMMDRLFSRPHVWAIKLTFKNRGTKTLKNVTFNWVLTNNGIVIKQDGAGFGLMYPHKSYVREFNLEVGMCSKGKIRLEVFLDPENYQGEPEALRGDNKISAEREIK